MISSLLLKCQGHPTVDKIHISLQFRPSVIRGPWIDQPGSINLVENRILYNPFQSTYLLIIYKCLICRKYVHTRKCVCNRQWTLITLLTCQEQIGTIHLRRRHFLGGKGSNTGQFFRWIVFYKGGTIKQSRLILTEVFKPMQNHWKIKFYWDVSREGKNDFNHFFRGFL